MAAAWVLGLAALSAQAFSYSGAGRDEAQALASQYHAARGSLTAELVWPGAFRTPDGERPDAARGDALWLFAKVRDASSGQWRAVRLAERRRQWRYDDLTLELRPTRDGRGAIVELLPSARSAEPRPLLVPIELDLDAGRLPARVAGIELFVLRMMRIPGGGFELGDGEPTTPGRFHDGADPTRPVRIEAGEGTAALRIGTGAGQLWSSDWERPARASGTGGLPPGFALGTAPFYAMKFPVTQGQYAAFLDTLPDELARRRWLDAPDAPNAPSSARGSRRARAAADIDAAPQQIERLGEGDAGAAGARRWRALAPSVAAERLSVEDALAFAQWAGLRLPSEFEFERAARGPLAARGGELAWGDTALVAVGEVDGVYGTGQELPRPPEASVVFDAAAGGAGRKLGRPQRVGLFAHGQDRRARGEGYFGLAEQSGNVAEWVVALQPPQRDGSMRPGLMLRGGSYRDADARWLRVSARPAVLVDEATLQQRRRGAGLRAVLSAE